MGSLVRVAGRLAVAVFAGAAGSDGKPVRQRGAEAYITQGIKEKSIDR